LTGNFNSTANLSPWVCVSDLAQSETAANAVGLTGFFLDSNRYKSFQGQFPYHLIPSEKTIFNPFAK